jgi:hypothetical protein
MIQRTPFPMLHLYANLIARVNGDLLQEQCGITIEDHVNRRCRITIDSALPEKGPEFDGRLRLGETVKLSVHVFSHLRAAGPAIVEIEGPIVASRIEQEPGQGAHLIFTVEQGRLAPDEG